MRLALVVCFFASMLVPTAHAAACVTGAPIQPANAPCDCSKTQCQAGQTCDSTGNGGNGDCQGGSSNQPAVMRCQNPDGTPLPSATTCEDKLDQATCDAVFGSGGTGTNGQQPPPQQGQQPPPQQGQPPAQPAPQQGSAKRSPKCDLPDLADMALKCAKTCQICCETTEHGCEDDPSYAIDCEQQKSKCKSPDWPVVMAAACGRTCGLCSAGWCRDNIQGCSSLRTQCRDYTHRAYMTQNCARTCEMCDPSRSGGGAQPPGNTCVDTGVNCPQFTNHCNDPNPEWQRIMKESCAKSCGTC